MTFRTATFEKACQESTRRQLIANRLFGNISTVCRNPRKTHAKAQCRKEGRSLRNLSSAYLCTPASSAFIVSSSAFIRVHQRLILCTPLRVAVTHRYFGFRHSDFGFRSLLFPTPPSPLLSGWPFLNLEFAPGFAIMARGDVIVRRLGL